MKKTFALFGLGHFGSTMLQELNEMNVEVLAVDKDEMKVIKHRDLSTHAVCLQSLDEQSLRQIGVNNVDHAFITFGEDVQGSILTAFLLKDMGIPKIWVKAHNEYHAKVLEKIGVDRVIQPEREMAIRVARNIVSNSMVDYIELAHDYSIAEILVGKKFGGCKLKDLRMAKRFDCHIVGIQREHTFIVSPSEQEPIQMNDILIVVGKKRDIIRFEKEGA